MKTNIQLIEWHTNSNTLRQYAVYLKLKHLFTNGCIYDYNVHKLSKVSGLSRNSIKKYIDYFLKNGWCIMHKNNLTFIALKIFKARLKIKLKTDLSIQDGSVQQILNNLRYELLKQKTRQFNYLRDIAHDLHNPTGIKKYKRALRISRKHKIPLINENALKISLSSIGSLLNLSPSTAHNLISLKYDEGKAKIIKTSFTKYLSNCSGKITKYASGYFKGGFYFQPKCNKYVFL